MKNLVSQLESPKTSPNALEGRLLLRLTILRGTQRGESVTLLSSPFQIGREKNCHLRLSDSLASRHHCVLELEGKALLVRDLGSHNGTLVNSRRVTRPTLLRDGDLLLIGQTLVRLDCVNPSSLTGSGDTFRSATPSSRIQTARA